MPRAGASLHGVVIRRVRRSPSRRSSVMCITVHMMCMLVHMTSRDAAATRQRILEPARHQVARHGYRAVTVKGVADAAGVSPNLITRYFGGKDGLFLAATRVEIPVAASFDGDRATLGPRLAASIVRRWFGEPGEDPLLALHRA